MRQTVEPRKYEKETNNNNNNNNSGGVSKLRLPVNSAVITLKYS